MNPYDIEIDKLKESKDITSESELIKLRLLAEFIKITENMKTREILEMTGLDKADLSRLRSFGGDRFSIDRIVTILESLGHTTIIKVKKRK